MSQAKVDKRKYEKKNRKEIERQRKVKLTVKCVTAALIVGAIIGIPFGYKIYKSMPKYVGDATVSSFINNYIDKNHAEELTVFQSMNETTEEATTEDDVTKAIEDASGKDLEKVDAENVDEVLGNTSEE